MATIKTLPFSRWWRAIKKKPVEQQREIFTKWLHYSCKTISLRGDMNQARIVYTIATRYNKSTFKKMTKENARLVYTIVNQKQQAHRRQSAIINELQERVNQLEADLAKQKSGNNRAKDVAHQIAQDNKNVKVTVKKHRKIITGGVQ